MLCRNICFACLAGAVLAFGPGVPAVAGEAELPPAVDGEASTSDGVHFLITDGGWTINTQYLPQSQVDRRGVLEFALDPLPQGAVIASAELGLDVKAFTHSAGKYPVLRICGYAGDGALSPGDATETALLIGQSDPVTQVGLIDVQLNAAFIDLLLGQASHLGLVALGSANGTQLGFAATEGAAVGYEPPLLSLSYSLPLPPPGDANGDDCVDGLDYNVWSLHYLDQPVPAWSAGGWTVGNFNEDACVDGLDYNVWSLNYLSGCDGAVPEPAMLALLPAAACLMLRRKPKSRSG